jgi:hypothetical protein
VVDIIDEHATAGQEAIILQPARGLSDERHYRPSLAVNP